MRPVSASNQTKILKWMLRLFVLMGGYRAKRNILSYFSIISLSLIVVHMFLDLSTWTGMETLKRVKFLPGIFVCNMKSIASIINANKLINLVKMLKHFWRTDMFEKQLHNDLMKIQKYITIICVIYVSAALFLSSVFSIKPFLAEDEIILIISDYALCDLKAGWCWWIMYIWQAYAIIFQILPSTLALDCIFIIFTGYIYNSCTLFTSGIKDLNVEDVNRRQFVLKRAVMQHDMMMMFVNLVGDLFSMVMLLQFSFGLWSMILFLNMIAAEGFPPKAVDDAIFYVVMYLVFVFQITMYSVGGTIIEHQIRSVSDNIFFGVDWFKRGQTDLRKDLTLMIQRAQNSKVLSAGKMSELNLALWIVTMKNSLSVFTLIWQLSHQEE